MTTRLLVRHFHPVVPPKVCDWYQAVRSGVQRCLLGDTDHAPMSALHQEDYQAAPEGYSTIWADLEHHHEK